MFMCGPIMAQGGVCNNMPGFTMCSKGTISKDVTANGIMKMQGTHVNGNVDVSGSLTAHDSEVDSLNINGDATMAGTTVHGQSTINGTVNANSCHFKGQMTIASNRSNFANTTLAGIHVKTSGTPTEQEVYLLKGTQVNGNIEFDSGQGTVYVSKGSSVSGKVKGGKLKSI